MSEEKQSKVVIIGSGPAGYTAGIYASRADLKPILFTGQLPGGQLSTTTDVENFPGFSGGVMGPDLMDEMRKQAGKFGCEIIDDLVTSVDLSVKPFRVEASDLVIDADTIIVSTGADPRMLGLEREWDFVGHGLSTCATCDGFFFRGKEVVVVGGGDSACEEADFLTKFASKVTMLHRRDKFRASEVMSERVKNNPKIEIIWNTETLELLGDPKDGGITGAKVKNIETGEEREVACDGLFYAIGHTPNTTLFGDTLEKQDNGYLKTEGKSSKTNISGVFACGDVQDSTYRQAITAAGSGCAAALDAQHYLESQE